MGEKRAYKPRRPGGGRRKSKPEYDAGKILKELMDSSVVLYDAGMSLQAIADELGLNPIKVRKLLITAGVYASDVEEKVQVTFDDFRKTQDHKAAVLSTANALGLSRSSVTSYLPYKKGVYFPCTAPADKISVGAERQRRYRAMKRKGRNGEYTKELWIDRREKSKRLAWSSVLLALGNIKGRVVDRPKALGDIRGVTYIYGMFYRFGLIDMPDEVKEKMKHPKKNNGRQ